MFHTNNNDNVNAAVDVSKVKNMLTSLLLLEETCREVSDTVLNAVQGVKATLKATNNADDETKIIVADIIKRRINNMLIDNGKRIKEALAESFTTTKS